MNCPICKRELEGKVSKHHLTPKLKGGKKGETVLLHQMCHSKIHSLFTEKEIAIKYNTIEKLLKHEEIIKFVEWVSKKPNDFYQTTKMKRRK